MESLLYNRTGTSFYITRLEFLYWYCQCQPECELLWDFVLGMPRSWKTMLILLTMSNWCLRFHVFLSFFFVFLYHHSNSFSPWLSISLVFIVNQSFDVLNIYFLNSYCVQLKRLKLRKNSWECDTFQFDEILNETASQKRVYEVVAKPVVEVSIMSSCYSCILEFCISMLQNCTFYLFNVGLIYE